LRISCVYRRRSSARDLILVPDEHDVLEGDVWDPAPINHFAACANRSTWQKPSRPSCSPYSPFLASLLKPLSLGPLNALRVAVGCHALAPRSHFTCRLSKLEWHKRLAARRPERHSPRCCLQGYLRLIGRRLFTDMRARFLARIDVALLCALLPSCNNPRAKIRAHERL
jgi:hypothetical protein